MKIPNGMINCVDSTSSVPKMRSKPKRSVSNSAEVRRNFSFERWPTFFFFVSSGKIRQENTRWIGWARRWGGRTYFTRISVRDLFLLFWKIYFLSFSVANDWWKSKRKRLVPDSVKWSRSLPSIMWKKWMKRAVTFGWCSISTNQGKRTNTVSNLHIRSFDLESHSAHWLAIIFVPWPWSTPRRNSLKVSQLFASRTIRTRICRHYSSTRMVIWNTRWLAHSLWEECVADSNISSTNCFNSGRSKRKRNWRNRRTWRLTGWMMRPMSFFDRRFVTVWMMVRRTMPVTTMMIESDRWLLHDFVDVCRVKAVLFVMFFIPVFYCNTYLMVTDTRAMIRFLISAERASARQIDCSSKAADTCVIVILECISRKRRWKSISVMIGTA